MQHGYTLGSKLPCLLHLMCEKLLSKELIERLVEQGIITGQ